MKRVILILLSVTYIAVAGAVGLALWYASGDTEMGRNVQLSAGTLNLAVALLTFPSVVFIAYSFFFAKNKCEGCENYVAYTDSDTMEPTALHKAYSKATGFKQPYEDPAVQPDPVPTVTPALIPTPASKQEPTPSIMVKGDPAPTTPDNDNRKEPDNPNPNDDGILPDGTLKVDIIPAPDFGIYDKKPVTVSNGGDGGKLLEFTRRK